MWISLLKPITNVPESENIAVIVCNKMPPREREAEKQQDRHVCFDIIRYLNALTQCSAIYLHNKQITTADNHGIQPPVQPRLLKVGNLVRHAALLLLPVGLLDERIVNNG